jgi:hypothetical protein
MLLLLQIPAGRRSVLDAYGEVILRGWREAVGPCLAEIEANLIQVSVDVILFWGLCMGSDQPQWQPSSNSRGHC